MKTENKINDKKRTSRKLFDSDSIIIPMMKKCSVKIDLAEEFENNEEVCFFCEELEKMVNLGFNAKFVEYRIMKHLMKIINVILVIFPPKIKFFIKFKY